FFGKRSLNGRAIADPLDIGCSRGPAAKINGEEPHPAQNCVEIGVRYSESLPHEIGPGRQHRFYLVEATEQLGLEYGACLGRNVPVEERARSGVDLARDEVQPFL